MRVGVEVGGTFTDLVAVEGGRIVVIKVPSTPRSPDIGAFNALTSSGIDLAAIEDLGHGSTVATNAVLERKGVEVRYHTMITNVIEQGGKVVGAVGFHVPSGAVITCHAKAVIMAMGGGVYKPAGWPTSGISHDGISIGYAA